MSRSIHENRARRRAHRNEGIEFGQLGKKRRIKRLIESERSAEELPFGPQPAHAMVFEPGEESPYLYFPASIDDMRAVLAALPPGALDGIAKIRLVAGTRYINESVSRYDVIDPYFKRKSVERPSRTYLPVILGTYCKNSHVISMYGYAKAPGTEIPVRQKIELELGMLMTLVHEVAHHFDRIRRMKRGRWRMDDRAKNERFAEQLEIEWGLLAIVPHMRSKYGERADRVARLIRHPRGEKKWRQGGMGHAARIRRIKSLRRSFPHLLPKPRFPRP
jgi:hypothetical protein